jgi:hypothetical protein
MKPHIKKVDGYWQCGTEEFGVRFCLYPRQAFSVWQWWGEHAKNYKLARNSGFESAKFHTFGTWEYLNGMPQVATCGPHVECCGPHLPHHPPPSPFRGRWMCGVALWRVGGR